jgi:ubiquinone/menaquinone biosynthesis C-methylase UbiE
MQKRRNMPLTFNTLTQTIFVHFRRRRMKRFFATMMPSRNVRVLDIGGTVQTWSDEAEPSQFSVTLLNVRSDGRFDGGRFRAVEGDAKRLPFADNTFDIAFSNSVIEHVGSWDDQRAFAREARRVARRLWIQTPARSFPIEAHLLAPYIQYLPKNVQHRIVRWTPRGLMTPDVVHEIVDEVRLLTFREFQLLFPDCHILRERFLGITKSYIAVRM